MAESVMKAETASPKTRRSTLGIVFATILIDFIGFSVLIPVLPIWATRIGAGSVEVGLILSLYAAAQLVFLPAWGWLSDRIGRRPVLLFSLLGTVLSFLLLAAAQSLAVIYLARVLAGFFAASIGTAQAVVADVTPPEKRASGMGIIGAAFGLGFVLGPALGGALWSVHELAPFYGIAILAAINLALAWWWLPESRPPEARTKNWDGLARSFVPPPIRLVLSLHDRRIALYLYLFLHLFAAFAALESMFTLYLNKRFGLGPMDAAWIFSVIGLSIAFTQGGLIRWLAPRLGERKLVVVGLLLTGAGLAAIPLVSASSWFFVLGPLIAIGNGLAFPTFTSLYSKACHEDKAGELLGESQSMATTGRIIGPSWAGFAFEHLGYGAPFLIAGLMMFAAVGLFLLWRRTLLGEGLASAAPPA